jgi:hypothetical protein
MMIISAEISSHEFVEAQFMGGKGGKGHSQLNAFTELFLAHAYECVCVCVREWKST